MLHRLDTLTSGILAFAKTPTEYARLRALWKTPDVKKIYRAVATSAPETPPPPNLIQWPIAHDAKKAKLMRAIKEKNGIRGIRGEPLPAKTRIISHQSISPVSRDFEIEITTGVMHQIRCHFSAAGWPLAGDPIYGGTPAPRLWLHAWRLSLPLSSGELLHLEAALPPEWPV
ncbi:MAG: hypothetical protein A2X94_01865 [Bdellovibrionales bacterium GWB1_55_8]|nr:MAG: hypothetical protein A2X94_01865 [Bdellovibrionales bacterium GWB1_55_8]